MAGLYSTNLLIMASGQTDTADPGTWAELNGHTTGGAAATETDYYIQGTACVSQSTGTATGTKAGLQYDFGSNLTWVTGYTIFAWMTFLAANAVTSFATGGVRLGIGSTTGNVRYWNALGNDTGRYPYGGWQNIALDPVTWWGAPDGTDDGTPVASNYRIVASLPNIASAVSKGNPHAMDIIRYGRGDIIVTSGNTGNYATFAGMATANDAQTARWGLFSLQQGSYLWKGLMSLGTTGSTVNFVDSNRNIVVDNTPRTYPTFNKIELYNAGSTINWTNISFNSLGTYSPGQFEVKQAMTGLTIDGCSFQNMDTFIFQSGATISNTTFQTCKKITSGGSNFSTSKVQLPNVVADASGFGWNNSTNPDGYMDNMIFTKGTTAHHAVEFGLLSPTTITLRDINFSGFNASNSQNDSTLYFLRTGGTVTVNLVGCSGNISYKSAGATINLVTNPVTLTLTVKDIDTGNAIVGARALVWVANSNNFPYQATVTITSSSTTATVTHVGHGLATNDDVIISGASPDTYNGAWPITVTSTSGYTYTMPTTATSPATGTIKSTLALINEVTDGVGVVSDSRSYASGDQLITGWVRMSTSAPYYKQQPINDTIDSVNGLGITVQLILDQ